MAEGKHSMEEEVYRTPSRPVNSPISPFHMEVPYFLGGDGVPGSFHKAE